MTPTPQSELALTTIRACTYNDIRKCKSRSKMMQQEHSVSIMAPACHTKDHIWNRPRHRTVTHADHHPSFHNAESETQAIFSTMEWRITQIRNYKVRTTSNCQSPKAPVLWACTSPELETIKPTSNHIASCNRARYRCKLIFTPEI